MSAIALDASVSIPKDVIFRELDGEAIILNLASGVYFGLNEVGSRIWAALAGGATVGAAAAAVSAEYDAAPHVVESDVVDLVEQLAAKGLVTVSAPGARR